jgi:WD40 repeat protein
MFLSDSEFKKYIHNLIADYFMGIWANLPKPYTYTEQQKKMFMLKSLEGEADRKVPAQPEYTFNPADNSIWYNRRKLSELPYHLIRSKRIKELNSKVLFNYKFVYSKLCCMPLNSLLMDFEDYILNYKYNKEVALISDALRLSSSILTSIPSNLGPQLIGRLLPYYFMDPKKFKNVRYLLEQCESEGIKDCALIPAYNCFHVPGGPLVYSLEGHPFAVYGICLLSDGMQLISVSNRFIVFDLSSGDIVRMVNPQIEGIMQTLSLSTDRKYCVSYTNNDQVVVWGIITNEVRVLEKVQQAPQKNANASKKAAKQHEEPKHPFVGISNDYGYLVIWNKYTYYLYSTKNALIKSEKYKYPIIQIEILYNESIKCCGIELEIISRTEDCNDDEEKERDNMLLEYKCIFDKEKLDKKKEDEKHDINTHYVPIADKMYLHSVLIFSKNKKRLYTCIEIADNYLECYLNKAEIAKKNVQKKRTWKYHNTLDENNDQILALVLSDNEKYLLAVVLGGFKVYYLKTGQGKPLKLPTGIKNVQIGYKKLNFPAVFSKNNSYIVTGVKDKIYIWDTSYGTLIKTLDAHYGRLTGLIGSCMDQKDLIISCSMDKTIKIWNLKNIMEEEFSLDRLEKSIEKIHISVVTCIALVQSRNQLAVVSLKDGKIKQSLCNNPHGAIFTCSALSTNGTHTISAESNRIVIWDMDETKVTFCGPAKPKEIQIKQITFINSDLNILCASLNTSAKLVTIENYGIPDGEIYYEIEYNLKNASDYKNFVLTSDESLVVIFRNDKKSDLISVYQTENGSHLHNVKLQYPNYIYNGLALSRMNGENLICIVDNEKASIINVRERKFLRSVFKWNGKLTTDDKYGLYAPTRGGLEILDLNDGSKVKTLIPKVAEGVFDIDTEITENDKHIIYYHSGKRTIRVFRIEDGKQIANFKCTAKLTCMKAAQDSKSLVIGCEDGSVNMLIIADPESEENVEYLKNWRQEQLKSFKRTGIALFKLSIEIIYKFILLCLRINRC